MMNKALTLLLVLLLAAPALAQDGAAAKPPVFSLAWSEYPSWSVFGVAHECKILDGKEGALSPLETKWGVDVVLKEAEYDPCLVMYGAGQCDAVCITNMDVLSPSLSVPAVAVMPTSTSHGADALIVSEKIKSIDDLKGRKVFGLAKTVSEYCFARNVELLGLKDADFAFTNMDPGAAAIAMQQGQEGYDAIIVWNPFVLETLNKRKDARVLFDSTKIPGEIVDMVVVSEAALARPGGEAFAGAVAEAFYAVCDRMADPKTGDDTLVALGEKFSHLNLESMKRVVEQTKFYATPEAGLAVYGGAEFRGTMERVAAFCLDREITARTVEIAFAAGEGKPNLRFETKFLEAAAAARKK